MCGHERGPWILPSGAVYRCRKERTWRAPRHHSLANTRGVVPAFFSHARDEDAGGDRVARAEPNEHPRGRRRKQAHAENGDGSKQARDRVRDPEVLLDLGQQWPDADYLRAQRERAREQRDEKRGVARSQAGSQVSKKWRSRDSSRGIAVPKPCSCIWGESMWAW